MSKAGVLQADGTRCRTGASCRRHGTGVNATSSWSVTKNLLSRPEDLPYHYDEELQDLQLYLKTTGLPGTVKPPYWNENALWKMMGEVEVFSDTSLLISAPLQHYMNRQPRNKLDIWLVKNGETVGMLQVLAQRADQPVTEMTPETTICCVEVKPEHQGKGYALELVRLAEKHVISTTIHSGGHYTPEGSHALAGKLPYTRQALEEKNWGGLGIGVHFRTMTFIHDWDNFDLK